MDETTSARETTLTRGAGPTDGVTAASAPGAGEADAVVSEGPIPASAMRAARDILRELIQFHLDGRVIHSRRILAELNKLPRD